MRVVVLASLLCLAASTLLAQSGEVTPFISYQAGGEISIGESDGNVDPSAAAGLFLTFDQGAGRKLDLLFSHQSTSADVDDDFDTATVDVTVQYAQIGGRYVFENQGKLLPYIAATVGATRVAIEDDSAVDFSFTFGGGADVPLSRKLALRLDGRFLNTLAGDYAEINCDDSGDCSGFGSGSTFGQFAASVGLVVKFD